MIEPGARIDMDDPSDNLRRASEQINAYCECIGAPLPPELPSDTCALLGTKN
jgi:hypothetical protein